MLISALIVNYVILNRIRLWCTSYGHARVLSIMPISCTFLYYFTIISTDKTPNFEPNAVKLLCIEMWQKSVACTKL